MTETIEGFHALSTFWLVSLLISAALAVGLTFFENRIGEHKKWLVAGGTFLPWLAQLLIAWNGFHFEHKPILGWIWPKSETTSIHLGYGPDSFSFGIVAVAGAVILVRALAKPLARLAAPALLFGYVGLILNWAAQTLGLSLIGLSFAILAGGMALIGRQRGEGDAHWVNQFLKRNVVGVLLAGIGACGLLSLGCPLDFTADPNLFATHAGEVALVTATLFLLAGLLLIVMPVTTQSSQATRCPLDPMDASLFLSLFPGISALAAFLRYLPHFTETGVLPYFGLTVIGLFAILCVPLYFKRDLKESISQFTTLFPSLALAAASMSGVWAGYVLALAFVTFAPVATYLLDGKKTGVSAFLLFFTIFGWMGGFGFASASGYLSFYDHPEELIYVSGVAALVVLLAQIQGWRYFFAYVFHGESEDKADWALLPLFAIVLVPLGVFYTGTISGGILPAGTDIVEVFTALPWVKFFNEKVGVRDENRYLLVTVLHSAVFVISLILGAVTQRNGKAAFSAVAERFPATDRWIQNGLGFDTVHDVFLKQGESLGRHIQVTVSKTVWERWIPGGLSGLEKALGVLGSWVDRAGRVFTSSRMRFVIEAPAKLVQLSQSGDVQAYLFFAIFWTLVIIVHFIRF